jgi:Tol biopolymer transport system component
MKRRLLALCAVMMIAAACAGDGGFDNRPAELIVFTGETYAVDMETGDVRRISGALKDVYYVPSPDGRTLVIGCDDEGRAYIGQDDVALCAYGPDGYVQLTTFDDLANPALIETDGTNLEVSWSPDGARLAFLAKQHVAGGQYSSGDLYVLELASGDALQLDEGSPVELRGPMKWSPDGTMIALRNSGRFGLRDELLLVAADGRFVDDLANPLEGDGGIEQYEWSRDSRQIAFIRNEGPLRGTSLYVADVTDAGGGDVRHFSDAWGGAAPAWSPDGEWIAAVRSVNNFSRVFVARSDGSERRDVGEALLRSESPAWSPDSERLVVAGAREPAPSPNEFPDSGLFVIDIDGGEPELISDLEPAFFPIVVVSPDGERVFLTAEAGGCFEGCPPGYLYVIEIDGNQPARRLLEERVSGVLSVRYR